MLKNDLVGFVIKVKSKAMNSVQNRHDKLIQIKKDELLLPYAERIEQLQHSFNMFSTKTTTLLTEIKEDVEIGYNGSYDISHGLNYLSKLKEKILYNSDFKGEVRKMYSLKDKEVEEVRENYNKVLDTCKSMNSAKRIAEYLEELGFDISTLKEDTNKSLVADIDRSKLFVCGENK